MGGKLKHGNCTACAVGNICGGNPSWSLRFMTNIFAESQRPETIISGIIDRALGRPLPCEVEFLSENEELAVFGYVDKVISDTGYTQKELAKIEWTFEMSIASDYANLSKTPEGQYIGLCAVLDVLHEIHDVKEALHRSRLDQVATGKGVDIINLQTA